MIRSDDSPFPSSHKKKTSSYNPKNQTGVFLWATVEIIWKFLGGGFKHFLFSPLGKGSQIWLICFKSVVQPQTSLIDKSKICWGAKYPNYLHSRQGALRRQRCPRPALQHDGFGLDRRIMSRCHVTTWGYLPKGTASLFGRANLGRFTLGRVNLGKFSLGRFNRSFQPSSHGGQVLGQKNGPKNLCQKGAEGQGEEIRRCGKVCLCPAYRPTTWIRLQEWSWEWSTKRLGASIGCLTPRQAAAPLPKRDVALSYVWLGQCDQKETHQDPGRLPAGPERSALLECLRKGRGRKTVQFLGNPTLHFYCLARLFSRVQPLITSDVTFSPPSEMVGKIWNPSKHF